jgi:hypothetical protein
MPRQLSLLAAAVAVVVLALLAARAVPPAPSVVLSDRTLVSPAGHRIGEFAAARNPANPQHLVVGAMDWDHETGGVGCAVYVSRDGGRSWIAGLMGPGLDEPFTRGDPWVAIDPSGRAHIQCMKFVRGPAEYGIGAATGGSGATVVQMHARSDDGGDHFGIATRIPPRDVSNQVDKESIYASRAGTLYACIGESGKPSQDLVVSRSFDGGESWTIPLSLDQIIAVDQQNSSGFGNCNGFAEGPNGEVYLLWEGITGAGARFGTVTTLDQGATWINGAGIDYWFRSGGVTAPAPLSPFSTWPSIAASPVSGDVFVTLQTKDPMSGLQRTHLWRSSDRGAVYLELPLPAVPSTDCAPCHQMRPAVTVDSQGRLGLQYVLTDERGLRKEVWFLISPDGGTSWLDPVQVARTDVDQSWLDPRNLIPAGLEARLNEAAYMAAHPEEAGTVYGWQAAARVQRNDHVKWGGDYWSITASGEGFVALWEDNAANGVHQLWSRIIRVTGT